MSSGFGTGPDTNLGVQSQKKVRDLQFRIKEEEELYYLCSENKDLDQLRGIDTACLHICFRIRKPDFLMTRLNYAIKMDRSH